MRVIGIGFALLAGALLTPCSAALAQLALPDVGRVLPSTGLPVVHETLDDVATAVDARQLHLRELLRRHRDQLDTDPHGELVIRSEVLAFAPSAQAVEAARAAGFEIRRRRELAGLDAVVYVYEAPSGMSTRRALKRLRALDPDGLYDFNHLYSATGEAVRAAATERETASTAPAATTTRSTGSVRIGLIDGGIQADHAALRGATLRAYGCDGSSPASMHGTAVASLLLAAAGLDGAPIRPVELLAADVYCGAATGGAVDAVVDALAWLARERVPVINVSLVGPDNALLRRVVERVLAQGHVIVAAVGNDGPAAGPLYPAAYDGVVAVTGVDKRHRVLLEACRGPFVDFAAPGADIEAAAPTNGYVAVRGTSFAAPIVAGLLASGLAEPGRTAAVDAIAALARRAEDLGDRGVDPVYGHGLVGGAALGAKGIAQRNPE